MKVGGLGPPTFCPRACRALGSLPSVALSSQQARDIIKYMVHGVKEGFDG